VVGGSNISSTHTDNSWSCSQETRIFFILLFLLVPPCEKTINATKVIPLYNIDFLLLEIESLLRKDLGNLGEILDNPVFGGTLLVIA
jgi:hypothetical protein